MITKAEESKPEKKEADLCLLKESGEMSGAFFFRTNEILESITDAFYTVDSQWRLTYINHKAVEWWRRSREELLGKVLWDIFPGYKETTGLRLQQAASACIPAHWEDFSQYLNVWVDVSAYPISDGGLAVYFRDITERKKAEEEFQRHTEELQRKEDENLEILDGAYEGSWVVDRIAGTIHCSEKWAKRIGLDQVPEKDRLAYTHTLAHPDDTANGNSIEDAMLKGLPRFDLEYRIKTIDSGYIWTQNRGKITYDENGKAVKVYAATTDITERKRTEEALCRNEVKLRNLMMVSSEVIYRMNKDWSMMSELYGKGFLDDTEQPDPDWLDKYIHPMDQQHVREAINEAIRMKKAFELEHRVLQADGTIGWTYSRAIPVLNEQGEITEWFGAASNITERKRAEEELKESQTSITQAKEAERQKLFDVLEGLPAMVCLLTPNHHIAFSNQAFRDKFGESKGRPCYKHVMGKDEPCAFCESFEAVKTGKSHHWEAITPDGSVIDVYDRPFTDADGSPLILEMDIDITERKRTDEALRQKEMLLTAIIEGITDPIFLKDLDSKILLSNTATAKAVGLRLDEITGKTALEYFKDKQHAKTLVENDQKVIREDKPEVFEEEIPSKGVVKVYLTTKIPWHDAQGNITGVLGIARDITERKKREKELMRYAEELKNKEKEYLEIIDGSSEGTFIHDMEKGEAYYSHEWMKRLGMEDVSPKEAAAAFDALVHPDDAGYVQKALQDACDGKAARIKVEFRAKTAEGQYIWILEQAKIIYNRAGRAIKYLGTHTDITGRKEMEIKLKKHASELDEKNRLITDFFTNVSHEFKTPLSVILIQLELMNLYLEEPAKLKEFIAAATQNSYRLNRLVANLLDVTKIDAGYMKAYYRPDDMVEAISELVESVKDYARKKGIEIEFKSKLSNLFIPMDSEKMERVMLNLLSNAIKHTQKGGHIRVGLKETKNRVQISVKDDGEGIPDEKKNVIFDRFRQVNTSLTRNTEGTGIGLSLTKALIELMQGRIWFNSKEGAGTEFIIELPILNGEKLARLPQMDGIGIGKKVAMEFSDLYIQP